MCRQHSADGAAADGDGLAEANGWWRSPVTVVADASDAGCAGLNRVETSVNGGPWVGASGPPAIRLDQQGRHAVSARGLPQGGQCLQVLTVAVNIDSEPAVATAKAFGPRDGNGIFVSK